MKEHNHLQRAMDELKKQWPMDWRLIQEEFDRLNYVIESLQEDGERAAACLRACDGVELEWLQGGMPGCVKNVIDERDMYLARLNEPKPAMPYAIEALIGVAHRANELANDAEGWSGRRDNMLVPVKSMANLNDALDVLDRLPDDQPGYVMEPAAKARWALREHFLVSDVEMPTEQCPDGWVEPRPLHSCGPVYDDGFAQGVSEAKRLNYPERELALLWKAIGMDGASVCPFTAMNMARVRIQRLEQARPLPPEATDEMLRAMLAVRWPATYREHLRHPMNGPESQKQNEEEIKVAQLQYRAAVKAWQ